ncbi:MAG TPA: hypothetical protein VHF69_04555 [Candidatus Synoicihabitans sp.]|nr:hypothetical protein [Candidatus Synoicihabitans sp.]
MIHPFRLVLVLVLGIGAVVTVRAQEADATAPGSIEWVVRSFMKEKEFPDRQRYYTADLKLAGSRPTPGSMFYDDKYELELRINEQDEFSAAVAVTMVDRGANQQSDYYLFLRRVDDLWKLAALRTFQQPSGMGQMYAALAAKGKSIDARDLRELGILQVFKYNDWALKQTFQQRREQLEEIAQAVMKKGSEDVIHGGQRSSRVDKKIWEQVRDSALNYVQLQPSGVIEFNAAAYGEAAVGFLHVGTGAKPPKATPEDYILVEPLDGPWYLYRRM